jgi:hypothetical protein
VRTRRELAGVQLAPESCAGADCVHLAARGRDATTQGENDSDSCEGTAELEPDEPLPVRGEASLSGLLMSPVVDDSTRSNARPDKHVASVRANRPERRRLASAMPHGLRS